jgi:organic hydroperoxide reductase OsmC/OhrA
MKPFPHHYQIATRCGPEGSIAISSPGLGELSSEAPPEFDGPGGQWSPETLLLAAVADCLTLSFRAMARASSLPWTELRCTADGTLDRVDGVMRFTEISLRAELTLPAGERADRARRLLERAEKSCPVSNSLAVPVRLDAQIREA